MFLLYLSNPPYSCRITMDEPRMTGSAGARGWLYSRDSWPGARLLAGIPPVSDPCPGQPSQYSSSRLQPPWRLKILLLLLFFKALFLLIQFYCKLTLLPVSSICQCVCKELSQLHCVLCKRDANLNLKSESPSQYSRLQPLETEDLTFTYLCQGFIPFNTILL